MHVHRHGISHFHPHTHRHGLKNGQVSVYALIAAPHTPLAEAAGPSPGTPGALAHCPVPACTHWLPAPAYSPVPSPAPAFSRSYRRPTRSGIAHSAGTRRGRARSAIAVLPVSGGPGAVRASCVPNF